jgi:hypothetical protein
VFLHAISLLKHVDAILMSHDANVYRQVVPPAFQRRICFDGQRPSVARPVTHHELALLGNPTSCEGELAVRGRGNRAAIRAVDRRIQFGRESFWSKMKRLPKSLNA